MNDLLDDFITGRAFALAGEDKFSVWAKKRMLTNRRQRATANPLCRNIRALCCFSKPSYLWVYQFFHPSSIHPSIKSLIDKATIITRQMSFQFVNLNSRLWFVNWRWSFIRFLIQFECFWNCTGLRERHRHASCVLLMTFAKRIKETDEIQSQKRSPAATRWRPIHIHSLGEEKSERTRSKRRSYVSFTSVSHYTRRKRGKSHFLLSMKDERHFVVSSRHLQMSPAYLHCCQIIRSRRLSFSLLSAVPVCPRALTHSLTHTPDKHDTRTDTPLRE